MRPYDVVLLGATGFTGRLVAEVLGRGANSTLKWAIAGRDVGKLQAVKTSLVGMDPANGEVGMIVADTGDAASLRAMAAQTRVVATTVGPFARYGLPVVAACVEEGTDYVDITGEPDFVSSSKAAHGEAARQKGLKIVHCCGFDSIPADLGALFTVLELGAGEKKQLRAYVKTNATFSGGTWASFIDGLGAKGKAASSNTGSPSPARRPRNPLLHRPDVAGLSGVAIPLPVIDPVLVYRSARAMPDVYGPDFEYGQFLLMRSAFKAALLASQVGVAWALAQVGPTRRALLKLRPSGTGPSEEVRERSFFAITFVGKTDSTSIVTRVSGGDPGYTETSKMLARSARLLAQERDTLPPTSGVLTPAVAFGKPGIAAMKEVGIGFEVVSGR